MISLKTMVLSAETLEATNEARKIRRRDIRRDINGTGICSRFCSKLQAPVHRRDRRESGEVPEEGSGLNSVSQSLRDRNIEEAHPGPDAASSRAQTYFAACEPLDVPILKQEIAAGGRGARDAMNRGGNLFAVIIRVPGQPGVVNVRSLRPDSLQTVDEDGRLCKLSTQLIPVKPLFRPLGIAFYAAVVVRPARQIEISDQLWLIVRKHVVALVGAVPFVCWAIQHVVLGSFGFAMRVLHQVIVPKIAHARHDPAQVEALAVIRKRVVRISR